MAIATPEAKNRSASSGATIAHGPVSIWTRSVPIPPSEKLISSALNPSGICLAAFGAIAFSPSVASTPKFATVTAALSCPLLTAARWASAIPVRSALWKGCVPASPETRPSISAR